MNKKRDQFLTEVMGFCWHEQGEKVGICGKCGDSLPGPEVACLGGGSKIAIKRKYNFDDWTGFGVLWEWAHKQPWWATFLFKEYAGRDVDELLMPLEKVKEYAFGLLGFVSPSRFPDAVYRFLEERA
jgi:hypothetical protein